MSVGLLSGTASEIQSVWYDPAAKAIGLLQPNYWRRIGLN